MWVPTRLDVSLPVTRSISLLGWALLGALSLPASPAPLDGQSAAIRERRLAAERFADSVASTTDRQVLQGWERELLLRARRERSSAAVHFRLGMLAIALDQPRDATAELKWATQLDPQWPAAWFGLGRAERRLGEAANATDAGTEALFARDAWARATGAFARAVELDAGLAPRLEALALSRRDAPSSSVYRDALRRLIPGRSSSARVAIAAGRVERLLGDSARAIAAFDHAASLDSTPSLGLLESARTRLTAGRIDGVDRYFRALTSEDPDAIALAQADLGWIASADELDRFIRASPEDRSQVAWRFWAIRDRAELRSNGERLIEHYRRLAAAERRFSNPDDQRVAVFIRHGEPDGRAALKLEQLNLNETWRYRRPEGDLVVHFAAGADTSNYRVTESLFDLIADRRSGQPAGDERSGELDLAEALLQSRAQLSPFYQAAAAGRREQRDQFRVREREFGRAAKNLALTTDRYPLRFGRDLPARFAFLGRSTGAPAIEVVFAVPTFALDSLESDRPLRVRVSAWNQVTEMAYALDTLVPAVPRRAGQRYGVARLAAPAGDYSVRAVIEAGGERGAFGAADQVGLTPGRVADRAGRLLLGVPGAAAVVAGDLPADPIGRFGRADTLIAWTEVGEDLDPKRVRIRLRSVSARKEAKWRDFPGLKVGTAVEVWSRVVRASLPMSRLDAGFYEVGLAMAGSADQAVWARARFEVLDPEK